MKKLIASAVIALAGFGFMAGTAGASAPSKLPKTWTPTAETAATVLIQAEPAFNEYAPECVLAQIEGEFSSPRGFVKHSQVPNDARITSVALAIVIRCETSEAY